MLTLITQTKSPDNVLINSKIKIRVPCLFTARPNAAGDKKFYKQISRLPSPRRTNIAYAGVKDFPLNMTHKNHDDTHKTHYIAVYFGRQTFFLRVFSE